MTTLLQRAAAMIGWDQSDADQAKRDFRENLSSQTANGEDSCLFCWESDRDAFRTCQTPCSHAVCMPCLDGSLLANDLNVCPLCRTVWYGKEPTVSWEYRATIWLLQRPYLKEPSMKAAWMFLLNPIDIFPPGFGFWWNVPRSKNLTHFVIFPKWQGSGSKRGGDGRG